MKWPKCLLLLLKMRPYQPWMLFPPGSQEVWSECEGFPEGFSRQQVGVVCHPQGWFCSSLHVCMCVRVCMHVHSHLHAGSKTSNSVDCLVSCDSERVSVCAGLSLGLGAPFLSPEGSCQLNLLYCTAKQMQPYSHIGDCTVISVCEVLKNTHLIKYFSVLVSLGKSY